MSVTIVLNIPEETAQQAQVVATTTKRRVEDVLTEWLNRSAAEIPVEELPDDEVRQLAAMKMPQSQQDELGDLLDDQREGLLTETGRIRLDELMEIYQDGMLRKAEAIKVAVERGLIPPLG